MAYREQREHQNVNPSTGKQVEDRDRNRDRDDTTNPGQRDANRDPISGAPGSHPVGVGVGAAAGGAAGAAAGGAAGAAIGSTVPGAGTLIGAAIGAVLGAVGGGYAGKGVAEQIDPTAEDEYWRNEYRNRPYYDERYTFEDDYAPAYGFGYAMRTNRSEGGSFDEAESKFRDEWERVRGKSRLDWDQARGAASDAWDRYDNVYASGRNRPNP